MIGSLASVCRNKEFLGEYSLGAAVRLLRMQGFFSRWDIASGYPLTDQMNKASELNFCAWRTVDRKGDFSLHGYRRRRLIEPASQCRGGFDSGCYVENETDDS